MSRFSFESFIHVAPRNIGVWVGPAFKDSLVEKLDSVAFQGVNEEDYPANLAEYVKENGSDSCADGLAASVDAYTSRCPDARIVISGWRYILVLSYCSCHH
jgi:cutinase